MAVNEMALVHITPYRQWLKDYLFELGVVKIKYKPKKPKIIEEKAPYVPCTIIEDLTYLKSLDPRNWKDQDHYAVLGIKHVRIDAADEDIKRAYRKIVLKHHPDKRGGEKIDTESDYFASIVKAYEILGDPIKRKSYDSVDKYFDDSIPEINNKTKKNFYQTFSPVFERNSRWSNVKPVPTIGNEKSDREDVEEFYHFWYNFDSWREFSYLDEEDKEKGVDREERRWIEKQNKAERLKRKKQETARIRQLVDNSYACDPRIPKFKAEDKERKNAKKKAVEDAKKAKQLEEEKLLKELAEKERLLKEEEERVNNEKKEQEKKAKASLRKLIRQEKKNLTQFLENVNYFTTDEKQKLVYLEEFYKFCDNNNLEELREMRKSLNNTEDLEVQRDLFLKLIKIENKKESSCLEKIKDKIKEEKVVINWSEGDTQLLAKAYNLFPAGAQNRWDCVADYIKQHSSNYVPRKPKEILVKVREMQKTDPSLKTFLVKNNNTKIFQPVENIINNHKTTNGNSNYNDKNQWSSEEQKKLEKALKTIDKKDANRWDKIAELVETKNKQECFDRCKKLVESIKLKKQTN